MCVNYRGLNWLTIKNQYPLLLISRLLDQFSHAKVYTKIDVRETYNLVRIWEGDEWKMEHVHNSVQPFWICCDALWPYQCSCCFQHMMNHVFCEYLDDFMVCYIDDILIFSKNMVDHERHVCLVLEKLREVGFYAKLEKCEFH
jgi:hypothetical protein